VILAFGDEDRDRAEAALRPHFPVFRVAPDDLRAVVGRAAHEAAAASRCGAAVYPPDRLARGETADVACTVDIDEHGAVTQVLIEQPVAAGLRRRGVEAIRRFRFSAAEIDGQPAPVRIRYVYHFVIRQERLERRARRPARSRRRRGGGKTGGRAGAEIADDAGAQATADAQGGYALETAPGTRKLTFSAPASTTAPSRSW